MTLFGTVPLINMIGLVTGSAAATQFITGSCVQVMFKARSGNVGSFFIGDSPTTVFWELDAGEETPWIPAKDLNQFYHQNPSGTLDNLSWWLQN